MGGGVDSDGGGVGGGDDGDADGGVIGFFRRVFIRVEI